DGIRDFHVTGVQTCALPIFQRMLEANVALQRPLWLKLSWMWIAFFAIVGAVNLYITYNFSTDVWAAFKLYGLIGLTLLFVLLQGAWLASKMPADSSKQGST